MRRKDRYDTADLDENQFEPGSRRRVLKNLLGITSKREMDRMEGREQVHVLEELAGLYDNDYRFTAADICRMHRLWLGRIYPWAGIYRQVNVKKDSFLFAAAAQIPKLMAEFEDGPLKRHTPCHSTSIEPLAIALAGVHVELLLIHPFREGNGRVARILAVLMGLQAGLPALFFDKLSGRKRQQYFAAVQAGVHRNNEPMANLFNAVIERTLQIHGK
jgi:cell filamentation protein